MNLMNRVFRPYIDRFIIVFIDDILIYSNSTEDYEQHLRIALQTLRDSQLVTMCRKYEFWLEEVRFLGHVVSREGISVDSTNVDTVLD